MTDSAEPAAQPALSGSDEPLATAFDVALTDLDGVVYRGRDAVPRAADALADARRAGMRVFFVTNNALRPPSAVAERLRGFGVEADDDSVVTSAQAAARILAEKLPAGAPVLVAGGAGLREAVEARGLRPVERAGGDDAPAAVVQGYDPELTYGRLAEAALAVRAGALWVASNADATVPTERGLLPGNGALVALVRTATGAEPIVAGKPEWALHAESMRRSGARRPLVVGDRLDTDIEAATRADTASLLVLTGVTRPADLLAAPAAHRPTFLAADLTGLLRSHPAVTRASDDVAASCGEWTCALDDGTLRWRHRDPPAGGPADGLDALRAACAAAWLAADQGTSVRGVDPQRPPGCEDLL